MHNINVAMFLRRENELALHQAEVTMIRWMCCEQGSCAGLEFKASLEKSLNLIKLKMSLNCFGKQVEGLEKFGICLCETFNKTW